MYRTRTPNEGVAAAPACRQQLVGLIVELAAQLQETAFTTDTDTDMSGDRSNVMIGKKQTIYPLQCSSKCFIY